MSTTSSAPAASPGDLMESSARRIRQGLASRLAPARRHVPFALTLVLAFFLLTINVATPWHSVYEDNGLAFEAIAINHIRFGLGVTKGESLADAEALNARSPKSIAGVPDSQQFQYLLTGPVHPFFYQNHAAECPCLQAWG